MNQEDFVIPQLYCPFPPEVNPHLEAVHEHTLAWARQFGMAKDGCAFERLRGSKFAGLAVSLASGRTWPHISRFGLIRVPCTSASI